METDNPRWWEIWPIINSLLLLFSVPIISGFRSTRREDLDRIEAQFKEVEARIDKLEERVIYHHTHHPFIPEQGKE